MIRVLISALCLIMLSNVGQSAEPDSAYFAKLFKGYKGSFILHNASSNTSYTWNTSQAATRYTPCSTFKIFNSMAALDAGVLKDEKEVIKWDGKKRMLKNWNKDHNLRTAIQKSVVWFYQELARRIGEEKMQRYLSDSHFGNMDMSGGLTEFWLVSSLKISAQEQIAFLKRVEAYRVPFSKRSVDILKDILIVKKSDNYVLRGKTGSGNDEQGSGLGWFVGWLERDGNRYFFAMNYIGRNASGQKAKGLTMEVLKSYKLMEE
jgi:beta-lactamase class D